MSNTGSRDRARWHAAHRARQRHGSPAVFRRSQAVDGILCQRKEYAPTELLPSVRSRSFMSSTTPTTVKNTVLSVTRSDRLCRSAGTCAGRSDPLGPEALASVSSTMIERAQSGGRRWRRFRWASRSSKKRPSTSVDAHGFEVAGHHDRPRRRDQRFARPHLISLGENDDVDCLPPSGKLSVAPAAFTPGSARRRRSASFVKPISACIGVARARQATRGQHPSGLNPGSTASTLRKLANRSPAPTNKRNANATCVTTSPRRNDCAPRPVVPVRPSSRSTPIRFAGRGGHRNQSEHETDHAAPPSV